MWSMQRIHKKQSLITLMNYNQESLESHISCVSITLRRFEGNINHFYSSSHYMIPSSSHSTMYCLRHCQFSSMDCLSKTILLKLCWIIHNCTLISGAMFSCLGPLSSSGYCLVSYEKNGLLEYNKIWMTAILTAIMLVLPHAVSLYFQFESWLK